MSRSAAAACDRQLLSAALRRRVGQGRALNVDQVAHAIGVKRRTFEAWLYGESTPRCLAELRSLITFFDAGFANDLLVDTGKVVADKAALETIPEAEAALRSLRDLAALLGNRE